MNFHEGSIPTELGNLANLTTFNAAFNRLSGSIPPMAGATSLQTFSVAHNQLTGELPTQLLSLPNLQASAADSFCLVLQGVAWLAGDAQRSTLLPAPRHLRICLLSRTTSVALRRTSPANVVGKVHCDKLAVGGLDQGEQPWLVRIPAGV